MIARMSISTRRSSKISRVICCVENNKCYILLNFLKKELLKQNHDDLYADYFEHEKTFDLLKKKYF